MNQKIYVGNLPYASTDQDLMDLFAQHGTVASANVVTDRYTGRSRGFGFVEMATAEDAQKAITALNGSDFQGPISSSMKPDPRKKVVRLVDGDHPTN